MVVPSESGVPVIVTVPFPQRSLLVKLGAFGTAFMLAGIRARVLPSQPELGL